MRYPNLLCLCLIVPTTAGWAGAKNPASTVQALGGSLRFRAAVDLAGRSALQQLQKEECRQVLSDFTDAGGRTLQQNLDSLGETAPDYLVRTVRFTTGSAYTRRCQNGGLAALTQPGSHVVLLCEEQFMKIVEDSAYFGGTIIIHETLHTLGLPENPPSSEEITAHVRTRCQ